MTVASDTSRNTYLGTGSIGPFAYNFRILAATDLLVLTRDSNGIETELSYPTDYSVSGVGNRSGGSVTLVQALVVDDTISIRRVRPLTQETDLRNNGPFAPDTIEDAFDHQIMVSQDLDDTVRRAVRLSDSFDPDSFDLTLPTPEPGTALVWNAAGSGLDNGTLTDAQLSTWSASQNQQLDVFVAVTHFTAGTTTTLTLSLAPGALANLWITERVGGTVRVLETDEYSLVGTTLTFVSPIPVGTTRIECRYFYTYQVNTTDASNIALTLGGGRTTIRLIDYLRNNAVEYNIKDYGAVCDGTTDDSAAIAFCITQIPNAGGILKLPPGTTRGKIVLPQTYPIDKKIHVMGSGKGVSFLTPVNAPDSVIVHDPTKANATDGVVMADFSVLAHPSGGGTSIAIDGCGFRDLILDEIGYSDNGTGYFHDLINLSSYRAGNASQLCYGITIGRVSVQSQNYGPKTIVGFSNGGLGAVYNCNIATIRNCWTYFANGTLVAVDAQRSAQVVVEGCQFEQSANMKAVILGTKTTFRNNWVEACVTNDDITYISDANGTSNSCEVRGNYLSSAGTITVPSACQFNSWEDNAEGKTIVDNGLLNTWRAGAEHRGYAQSAIMRRMWNKQAGGAVFDEYVTATGSPYGAGNVVMIDVLTGRIVKTMEHAGAHRYIGGSSVKSTMDLVPYDDLNPTQIVWQGTDASGSVAKTYGTKEGIVGAAIGVDIAGQGVLRARLPAISSVAGTAGGTYTAAEQTQINALTTAVNAILGRMRGSTGHGLIVG
jgi:hypothetical protein